MAMRPLIVHDRGRKVLLPIAPPLTRTRFDPQIELPAIVDAKLQIFREQPRNSTSRSFSRFWTRCDRCIHRFRQLLRKHGAHDFTTDEHPWLQTLTSRVQQE
jgi:hypothetical protein